MGYCDYGPPDSWYEPDYEETPADHGWIHEDDLPDLDSVRDFLTGVIEAVYVTGDVESLENCLDEICGQFDLKLPAGQPILKKRTPEFSDHLFNLGVALSRAQATATQ